MSTDPGPAKSMSKDDSAQNHAGGNDLGTQLAGMLAEVDRARVFGALLLGAESIVDIGALTGLDQATIVNCVNRFLKTPLVVTADGRLVVDLDVMKASVKQWSQDRGMRGSATGRTEPVEQFINDRHLVGLPSRHQRRRVVLEHVADTTFVGGETYSEREVNELLSGWCEGSRVDHVALRRYLVDHHLLARAQGRYWLVPVDQRLSPK